MVKSAPRAESPSREHRRPITDGALSLRAFTPADADQTYLRWLRDPEVTEFIKFAAPTLPVARRYVREAIRDPDARFFAICLNGRKIGTIKLAPIQWAARAAEVGLMIGARRQWGKGYGRRAILLACRYAYERLGLRYVTAGIEAGNIGSVKSFERAGFEFQKEKGAWRCLKRLP